MKRKRAAKDSRGEVLQLGHAVRHARNGSLIGRVSIVHDNGDVTVCLPDGNTTKTYAHVWERTLLY